MNIAIITACPSGVANSIIAAGLLEQAAKALNWNAMVECHSSVMEGNTLSADDIAKADTVVIATNTPIDTTRFVGKKSLPGRDLRSHCRSKSVAGKSNCKCDRADFSSGDNASGSSCCSWRREENRCNYSVSYWCCTHLYGS
jgi:fructose-specific phosphotransferase system IIB component